MRLYWILSTFLFLFTITSCNRVKNSSQVVEAGPGCEFATNFGILNSSNEVSITIRSNEESSTDRNDVWLAISANKHYERIVCMSTSHISYIEALNESSRIVGVSGGQYISSLTIQKGLNDGSIADIGYEGSLNYELLLSLNPDLVLTYGIEGENNQYIEKIKQFGINVISLGDYLENHPLGKLEYIKLFGVLFDKKPIADSIYNIVRNRYFALLEETKNVERTKVLINAPWKDVWYIPGKKSYMNLLVQDAGGEILGSEDNISYTKAFSIEDVYMISEAAEVWINPNSISSLKELKNAIPLFKNFSPVINKKVYNNIKLCTPGGGSQFWESGVIEPDIVLKDLISILHPELLKNYTPKYYLNLE